MHPNNLEDAKCYVDWIIEIRAKVSQNSERLKNQNNQTSKDYPKSDHPHDKKEEIKGNISQIKKNKKGRSF